MKGPLNRAKEVEEKKGHSIDKEEAGEIEEPLKARKISLYPEEAVTPKKVG